MESAKIYGSDEDGRSCESGWTMYLASQSHDNEDDCYYDDYDDYDDEEEDSDGGDSMDSDASSGPMEATSSCLKPPQEIEEQNSIKKKKKKTNEDMVLVETTRVHNTINDDDDDDDGDDHYNDDGNDSYSVVHSYVGSVRREGDVREELRRDHSTDKVMKVADDDSLGLLRCTSMPSIMGSLWSP